MTNKPEETMANNFTGGCLCGQVRYECSADPFFMGNCHCRDCQKSSGGAYEPDIGLPAGMRGSFQGAAKAFQASVENQPPLILAALVTVYIVLGILYESYIHPLTILSTLPSAGVGA